MHAPRFSAALASQMNPKEAEDGDVYSIGSTNLFPEAASGPKMAAIKRKRAAQQLSNFKACLPGSSVAASFKDLEDMLNERVIVTESGLYPSSSSGGGSGGTRKGRQTAGNGSAGVLRLRSSPRRQSHGRPASAGATKASGVGRSQLGQETIPAPAAAQTHREPLMTSGAVLDHDGQPPSPQQLQQRQQEQKKRTQLKHQGSASPPRPKEAIKASISSKRREEPTVLVAGRIEWTAPGSGENRSPQLPLVPLLPIARPSTADGAPRTQKAAWPTAENGSSGRLTSRRTQLRHPGGAATARATLESVDRPPTEPLEARIRRVQDARLALEREEVTKKHAIATRVDRRHREIEAAQRRTKRASMLLSAVAAAAGTSGLRRCLEEMVGRIESLRRWDGAAAVVQRAWRLHFGRRLLQVILAMRRIKGRFVLHVRVERKRKAVVVLLAFLRAAAVGGPGGPRKVVHRYLRAAKTCQRTIRSFLLCRRAQTTLLTRHWEVVEAEVRRELVAGVARQRQRWHRQRRIGAEREDKLSAQWGEVHMRARHLLWRIDRVEAGVAAARVLEEQRLKRQLQQKRLEKRRAAAAAAAARGDDPSLEGSDAEASESTAHGSHSVCASSLSGGGSGSKRSVGSRSKSSGRNINAGGAHGAKRSPRAGEPVAGSGSSSGAARTPRPPPPRRMASADSVDELARLAVPHSRRLEAIRRCARIKTRMHASGQRSTAASRGNRVIDERDAALLIAGDPAAALQILGAAGYNVNGAANDSAAAAASADVAAAAAQVQTHALLLTGDLGRPWKAIVAEEVVGTWRDAVETRDEPKPYLKLDLLLAAVDGQSLPLENALPAAAAASVSPGAEMIGGLPSLEEL